MFRLAIAALLLTTVGAAAQSSTACNTPNPPPGCPTIDNTLPDLQPPFPPQTPVPPGQPEPPLPPIAEVPTLPPPVVEIGEAVDELPPSNPIPPAIRELPTRRAVKEALQQLGPPTYSNATEALIEGTAHQVRDAVDDALNAAFDGVLDRTVVAEDLGEGDQNTTYYAAPERYGPNLTIWSQGFANWNTKPTSSGDATGVFVGADSLVMDNLILGVIGGYDRSNTDLSSSTINSDSYTIGAYSGVILKPWTLKLGGTYTFSDTHVDRSIRFGRFQDFSTVDYNSGMGQVFGGIGYRFSTGPIAWNPYADLAYVFVNVDPFTENGGPAALSVLSHESGTLISTIGLRNTYKFEINNVPLKIKTRIGWRRSLSDLDVVDTVLFTGAGIGINDAFDIPGSTMAKDIALVDFGVEAQITPAATFSLTFNGQYAKDEYKNGLTGLLRIKF